ncbi:MAG TPA: glycosyltransferase family A protein [Bacillota bacterium]|nr:glycosyltransferase family A protein [Bacillota bacterium]
MFSIGITTFKYRFQPYFIPLVNKIKEIDPAIEIVVAANGEHRNAFDENYRKNFLKFISEKQNVIPVMFPCFRGLAKLWNNIVIFSSSDFIFLLNDDVAITDKNILQVIGSLLVKNDYHSFKINHCWSHMVLNKSEVDELGYFDERLLGIGEEDRDFEWRYGNYYHREFQNFDIPGILNFTDMTHQPSNIKIGLRNKYSFFNTHFIYHEKYQVNETAGEQIGMWPEKMLPLLENSPQYPYEKFFKMRQGEL